MACALWYAGAYHFLKEQAARKRFSGVKPLQKAVDNLASRDDLSGELPEVITNQPQIMTVELNSEQERLIRAQLASGQFKTVDEVLTTALARLLPHNRSAVERMIEFSRTHSVKLPAGETVENLVREVREGHRH